MKGMRGEHDALAALCRLGEHADATERQRIWRDALAALSSGDVAPSALEPLAPAAILQGMRVVLATGLIEDLAWLPSGPAYLALYHLASALPQGRERRELGRMVLDKFRQCDAQTFVQLADRLALGARDAFSEPSVRLRLQAELLHCPLHASHTRVLARLALTIIARSELRTAWLTDRSQGSLTSRRVAARLLELATRHAVYLAGSDNGPLGVLASPQVADAMARLLYDREPLVWRHAAVARGLLALHDVNLAAAIQTELDGDDRTGWRHGATSLAAMVERMGDSAKPRINAAIDRICGQDRGVSRAFLMGLEGAMLTWPELSDDLAGHLVAIGGLDAALGLAELRRALGEVAPRATNLAMAHIAQGAWRTDDLSETALMEQTGHQLDHATAPSPLGAALIAARDAMRNGHGDRAIAATHQALVAIQALLDRLQTPELAPTLELSILVEIDRELLTDSMIHALLATTAEAKPTMAKDLGAMLARLETILLAAESAPEQAATIANATLRMWRLRTLLRLLDRDALDHDKGSMAAVHRARRVATVVALARRAAAEHSPLQRSVSAAMMRGWDALLRDQAVDLVDLLFATATIFDAHYDESVLCQATRSPATARLIANYAGLQRATWAAQDPAAQALPGAIAALRALAEALPIAATARTDALRWSLVRFVEAIAGLTTAATISDAHPCMLHLATTCDELAALAAGAARRLELPERPPPGVAITHLATIAERAEAHASGAFAEAVALAADELRMGLLPAFADLSIAALIRYAALPVGAPISASPTFIPVTGVDRWMQATQPAEHSELPEWMPLSRMLGGFLVQRALGAGNSGSVFVARRRGNRATSNPDDSVALKVPDFDSGIARNLSQQEFERLFREEAGALLALPNHANLARFISFDATATPKPILVMEYVRGPTLEQLLDSRRLDVAIALGIADDIAAGLAAMHEVKIAHLDVKPANVVIRNYGTPRAHAVLVDFGLAGRQLRWGCGSPYYGAPEVWNTATAKSARPSPLPTDVYAFACLVFELCTGRTLVEGATLTGVLAKHLSGAAAKDAYWRFATKLGAPRLADVLAASLARDANQRPPIAELKQALRDHRALFTAKKWPMQ